MMGGVGAVAPRAAPVSGRAAVSVAIGAVIAARIGSVAETVAGAARSAILVGSASVGGGGRLRHHQGGSHGQCRDGRQYRSRLEHFYLLDLYFVSNLAAKAAVQSMGAK